VTDAIAEITPNGIVTADGRCRPVDAIICGTGFAATQFLAPMAITGRNGTSLRERWKAGAEAYLGITVADFPNFFMLYGPNTNLGVGTIIFMLERQQRYVVKCIELLRDRDGSERMNRSRFDQYHRYAGSATVRYGAGESAETPAAAPVKHGRVRAGTRVGSTLDVGIPVDAAVGDLVTGSGEVTARITDLRRAGDRWSVELTLVRVGADRAGGTVRRVLKLPVPAGASFTWRVD